MLDLIKERGEIVEHYLHIEQLLSAIIQLYYKIEKSEEFVLDVLYDETFSTGLRIKILKKIYYRLEQDKKKVNRLNEKLLKLNQIRNYFVHCDLRFIEEGKNPYEIGKNECVVDPKKHDKFINFDDLYRQFFSRNKEVEEELIKILESIGGTVINM